MIRHEGEKTRQFPALQIREVGTFSSGRNGHFGNFAKELTKQNSQNGQFWS